MDESAHNHHPNVGGGPIRAAIFGVSDGLVSNVALVLGVAGASAGGDFVRLAGLAGLVAGACSMAAGEYVSMRAQTELLEHELAREARELAINPDVERDELIAIYESRGVSKQTATAVATELMSSPEGALQSHAREELGIDPDNLGSPIGAAVSSFLAFCLGAILPLLPWFWLSGATAVLASVGLAMASSLVIGAAIGAASGRSRVRSATRQLALTAVAAAITYAIGSAIGSPLG